ncbi:hypothetical protein GGI07_002730 [Coemansia sp. Benny D115]|nr:hypothetical protein GGI07_002730 [Coemansia sp. Benny D115]
MPLLQTCALGSRSTQLLRPTTTLHAAFTQRALFHSTHQRWIVHRASHYDTLGVPVSATQKEIKTAFYQCSMKWHPDRNQGSDEAHKKFLRINEAYSILGNEQKRQTYDRTQRIRQGSHAGPRTASQRHGSAFSRNGEYSSTRVQPDSKAKAYTRPMAGSYTGRKRSNFEEWERQHYQEMKARAETIGRHAKDSAGKSKYSNTQVAMYQFWEMMSVAAVLLGLAWAGSGSDIFLIRGNRETVSGKAQQQQKQQQE